MRVLVERRISEGDLQRHIWNSRPSSRQQHRTSRLQLQRCQFSPCDLITDNDNVHSTLAHCTRGTTCLAVRRPARCLGGTSSKLSSYRRMVLSTILCQSTDDVPGLVYCYIASRYVGMACEACNDRTTAGAGVVRVVSCMRCASRTLKHRIRDQ